MFIEAVYTVGVYGLTEQQYFQKLLENKIDAFIDIRQRRAVRGSKYAFVNSTKLQNKLRELGIKYFHIIELAPTTEIRELQKKDDQRKGINKVDREELGQVFKEEYKHQVLDNYNLSDLMIKLDTEQVKRPVLFCVEKTAKACHRSLVADKIHNNYSIKIANL